MEHGTQDIRWGVEQRLEFIEFRLFWEGGVNRADIIDMFGVSVPQASKDLSLYQEHAPGNVVYDKSAKRYVAAEQFSPRFLKPDPDVYLSRLRSLAEGLTSAAESWIAQPPGADIALTPKREIDIGVLRAILNAVRDQRSIEVLYQSMNRARPEPVWRRITPHAFGYDGLRWHARAYCHLEDKFKDFLLPRALDARNPGEPGAPGSQDKLWNEYFKLEIAPHPGLTDGQKRVVAKDYGFKDGKGSVLIRYAMLFYVLKRLGLLSDPEKEDPRRQHIVALNKAEVLTALEQSNMSQEASRDISALAGGE
ncbi:WYL domain-containing protein [Skermanella rosea]|uniref:WYL domain-containing protein n=1 Tax=Skermanella rosea TaxID=1817965 RepID=UPI001931CCDD|nr:WYL domain-containing protein [Skermanella rosea]UEM04726.1 WYL domain-containing protein [Skermanella rosea]